jgi:hypothetical protein
MIPRTEKQGRILLRGIRDMTDWKPSLDDHAIERIRGFERELTALCQRYALSLEMDGCERICLVDHNRRFHPMRQSPKGRGRGLAISLRRTSLDSSISKGQRGYSLRDMLVMASTYRADDGE